MTVLSEYPHIVNVGRDQYHQLVEICNWCEENIGVGGYYNGAPGWQWSLSTVFGYSEFSFRREEDAALFILRWS